jgi:hypothetical protein
MVGNERSCARHADLFVSLVGNARLTQLHVSVVAMLVGNVRANTRAYVAYGCGQIRSSGNWPVTT